MQTIHNAGGNQEACIVSNPGARRLTQAAFYCRTMMQMNRLKVPTVIARA